MHKIQPKYENNCPKQQDLYLEYIYYSTFYVCMLHVSIHIYIYINLSPICLSCISTLLHQSSSISSPPTSNLRSRSCYPLWHWSAEWCTGKACGGGRITEGAPPVDMVRNPNFCAKPSKIMVSNANSIMQSTVFLDVDLGWSSNYSQENPVTSISLDSQVTELTTAV